MADRTIVTGVLLEDTTTISFVEVCELCHMSEDVLLELVEYGLLGHPASELEKKEINRAQLARIQSASRLQHDLELNVAGVVLAMELLDELGRLRDELCILQRHVEQD